MSGDFASGGGGDAESAARPTGRDRGDRATTGRWSAAPLFVWGIWGLMLLGNLALVFRYTSPYPIADELYLLSGSGAAITPQWLWEQHAEHRVPLAKLIWLGVLKLSNYDFRAGNVVSVLSVAATAAALIAAAGRLRGRARFTDAFFPLSMLGFGQAQNFLWWWVYNHILPHLIACGLLLALALRGREPLPRDLLLVAAVLVLLSLSGPGGLPYVLAGSAWLGYRGASLLRSPGRPHAGRDGLAALGLGAASAALVGLYFVGFRVEPGTAAGLEVPETGVVEEVKASLRLLGVAFGSVVTPYVRLVSPLVLGLMTIGAALLARAWIREPDERFRASGLLLFLGAAAALMLAVGRARAGFGWEYLLMGIHLNLAIPALRAVYLTGILYGRPALGDLMQVALFTLTCFFFLPNYESAVEIARSQDEDRKRIDRDIRAGVPVSILAERCYSCFRVPVPYDHTSFPVVTSLISGMLRDIKELGIAQFRDLADDPAFRPEALPVEPSGLDGASREGGVAYSQTRHPEDASLLYTLDGPRFVYAIRLRCAYEDDAGRWAEPRVTWAAGVPETIGDGDGPIGEDGDIQTVSTGAYWLSKEREDRPPGKPIRTVTFWVNSEIDRFRIYPDTKGFAFRVAEIELLVP